MDEHLARNLGILAVIIVPIIAGAIMSLRKKRRQKRALALIACALQQDMYPEALELAREILFAPCDISSVRSLFGMGGISTLEDALDSQLVAVDHLSQTYRLAETSVPDVLLSRIAETIGRQDAILQNEGLLSVTNGQPKPEFIRAFVAVQHEKEQLVQSLPEIR